MPVPSDAACAPRPDTGFVEALLAPAPPDRGGTHALYARLIGDWDAEVVDHLPDGTDRRQSAEVHFAWVLGGRAVQDVWIVPARSERVAASVAAAPGNRCGTTLRLYDPRIDAWRITWFNPVTGVEERLVGRAEGSCIVHHGTAGDGGRLRWTLDASRPDEFHWRGERSEDGGESWTCATEYFARRRPAAGPRLERRVAWAWTDRPGLETLRLVRDAAGAAAEGSVLVVLEGVPLCVRYRVEHAPGGRFRRARIEAAPSASIDVRLDAAGLWTLGGAPRSDLEGCADLDLAVTPYTNTPALLARPLRPGETRRLRVAWMRFPSLEVTAVEQEYTRLDAGRSPARYRYRNHTSGFTGELALDGDGLVLDFGPWTRR